MMVAYHQFVELAHSEDSEARGQAAHMAALAYLSHTGPADEQAALYASLISFLDDPSVKVRAAMAYGLLHAREAPRPILLALLHDSAVISRAIAQYSPALIDADLIALIRQGDMSMLQAICLRERLDARVVETLLDGSDRTVTLRLLARPDVSIGIERFNILVTGFGAGDAQVRGALLSRHDLPAQARLLLIEHVAAALRGARVVSGAIAANRLDRVLRDATDMAMTEIGEREAARPKASYAADMVQNDKVSTRVMLHAICNGHVLFFADCVAELSDVQRHKVFSLLESGSRSALNALFSRCGLPPSVRNLIARLVFHARAADLTDDVAARHFVVTVLTEELIIEHDGRIPEELEEAFSYLCEQNVTLARTAARGVMAAFADPSSDRELPVIDQDDRLALPAA